MNWKFWQSAYATPSDGVTMKRAGKAALGLIGAYLLIAGALGWWWDYEPATFAVRESAASRAQASNAELVTGYIVTATLIRMAEALLDKRGGYLSNDVFPPGVWMDNLPNWEFGVLTQIRDTAALTASTSPARKASPQRIPTFPWPKASSFSTTPAGCSRAPRTNIATALCWWSRI